MTTATIHARESERYEIVEERQVALEIESDDLRDEATVVTARLLNLSTQGAKLAVPKALPRDRAIRLKLCARRNGRELLLVHARLLEAPAGEHGFTVGCQLSPNVPASVLQHISKGAKPERRDDDRRPTAHETTVVRKSLFRTKEEPGTLRNFAAGGVCVEVGTAAKLGETLSLRFGDDEQIPLVEVVVRWQLQEGNRFLLGCEYTDVSSFAMLASLLK
ncbi:MAG: PilZ domain-containing protein [Pirellulales bacterium]